MQVTKGTWRMREQCVPGSLSSSPAREPGNEASTHCADMSGIMHIHSAYVKLLTEVVCFSTLNMVTRSKYAAE